MEIVQLVVEVPDPPLVDPLVLVVEVVVEPPLVDPDDPDVDPELPLVWADAEAASKNAPMRSPTFAKVLNLPSDLLCRLHC